MTTAADVAHTAFADRWVIVSGASSGLGRAIAIDLTRRGARVVLVGRREQQLRETASLAGDASRTEICVLDLTELDAITPAVKALAERTGNMYGLVHAAGVSH